jgi:hypothetical protein
MRNFVEVKLALCVFGRVLECSNASYLLEWAHNVCEPETFSYYSQCTQFNILVSVGQVKLIVELTLLT